MSANDFPLVAVQLDLAGQVLASNAADTKLSFGRVLNDTNGDWNPTALTFTPDMPGWYMISGEVVAPTCQQITVTLYTDGVAGPAAQNFAAADALRSCNFCFVVKTDGLRAFDLRAKVANVALTNVTLAQLSRATGIFLRGP